ncbi:MAG: dienelactone hydrolase family protein [Alphaproteobacteria bacterium]
MSATAQAGEIVRLRAADGHSFDAYLAEPPEGVKPRGGIVVLMEIFGLTPHLRGVCDGFAKDGYRVVAPAIFDRVERDAIIPYTPDGLQRALAVKSKHGDWGKMLLDTEAARDAVKSAGKVACVGYCFGGSIAWLASAGGRFDAVVSYYGSEMMAFLDITPTCPVECHIGTADHHLTPPKVDQVRAAYPDLPVHLYEGAEHGFNCESMAQRHHPAAAKLARERTLAFLRKHIG